MVCTCVFISTRLAVFCVYVVSLVTRRKFLCAYVKMAAAVCVTLARAAQSRSCPSSQRQIIMRAFNSSVMECQLTVYGGVVMLLVRKVKLMCNNS